MVFFSENCCDVIEPTIPNKRWGWSHPLESFTDAITSWVTVFCCNRNNQVLFRDYYIIKRDLPTNWYFNKPHYGCHKWNRLCLPFWIIKCGSWCPILSFLYSNLSICSCLRRFLIFSSPGPMFFSSLGVHCPSSVVHRPSSYVGNSFPLKLLGKIKPNLA